MERMKACTKCGVEKPISDFSKHRLTNDGHAYQCKECNARRAGYWRTTPSGVYTSIKGRLNYYKKKPMIITKRDFIEWYVNELKICAYCDIPEDKLEVLGDSYNSKAHRLTVDRVENSTGYVMGNMVLACLRCNSIKSDLFTHKEMRQLAQQFIKPKWERRLS